MDDQFAALDALGQAELVRRRQVSPLELVDAAIACIERLNPVLATVITPLFEQARSQATSPTCSTNTCLLPRHGCYLA